MAIKLADPSPVIQKINELEAKRKALILEIDRIEGEQTAQKELKGVTEKDIASILDGPSEDLSLLPRERWKDILKSMIDQIELDPATMDCRIKYRITLSNRVNVASPRGFEPLLPP